MRDYIPHVAVFGGAAVLLLAGVVAQSVVIALLAGGTAAMMTDPLRAVAAVVLGLAIRRHDILPFALAGVGMATAILVDQMNAGLGLRSSPLSPVASVLACLLWGYLGNLVAVLFRRSRATTAM